MNRLALLTAMMHGVKLARDNRTPACLLRGEGTGRRGLEEIREEKGDDFANAVLAGYNVARLFVGEETTVHQGPFDDAIRLDAAPPAFARNSGVKSAVKGMPPETILQILSEIQAEANAGTLITSPALVDAVLDGYNTTRVGQAPLVFPRNLGTDPFPMPITKED